MSRLLVDGVRYEVRAGGYGPPLVLLHGFTGRGASWGPHLPAMRRVATTVQVDLLGHGRSDAPADPARHEVERQAADIAEIVRRVAGGRADVLGYSFGARIALALAIAEPGAVRRLVLESPSAGFADVAERETRRLTDEALATMIEREGIASFIAYWESLPLFSTHAALTEPRRRRLHAERLRNHIDGLAGSLRGAGQGAMTPLHGRLASVTAPTLVICGALDPGRARAESVAARIPGARLETIDGAGHTPHLEAPVRFREIVLPFITAPEASVPIPVPEEVA
ncbi:MAG: alpha/beta fold hydrolase [Candidatus Limnocylindrales bacterium]